MLVKTLSRRALNRALLDRQLLLRRSTMPAAKAIEHLVGLQSQNPPSPYYALWSRLASFRHDAIATLIESRRAVRIALMRSTIHLTSARDCLTLRPLVQSVIVRSTNGNYGKRLVGVDREALAAAARTLVEERPRTLGELGSLLRARWPDRDAEALANMARALVPLVQPAPRGVWGVSTLALHTSAESWLGKELEQAPSLDKVVLRYLSAFGPATPKDAQVWSGLRPLREVFERLRPRLRTFRDEQGQELFDIPDAPRPDADVVAPPRFLPDYDNVLLSHADRSRIVSDVDRRRFITANGLLGTVLIDGFVGAAWRLRSEKRTTTLEVAPFVRLRAEERRAVEEEGTRLLAFAAGDATTHTVRIVTERRGATRRS